MKSWFAELDALRCKLRDAACVDLGYDLSHWALELTRRWGAGRAGVGLRGAARAGEAGAGRALDYLAVNTAVQGPD